VCGFFFLSTPWTHRFSGGWDAVEVVPVYLHGHHNHSVLFSAGSSITLEDGRTLTKQQLQRDAFLVKKYNGMFFVAGDRLLNMSIYM